MTLRLVFFGFYIPCAPSHTTVTDFPIFLLIAMHPATPPVFGVLFCSISDPLPCYLSSFFFIPVPCPHCSHHPYQPPTPFPSVLAGLGGWCVWFVDLGSDCQVHEFIWTEQPVNETQVRADLSLPCLPVSGHGGGRCHQVLHSLDGSSFILKVHKLSISVLNPVESSQRTQRLTEWHALNLEKRLSEFCRME